MGLRSFARPGPEAAASPARLTARRAMICALLASCALVCAAPHVANAQTAPGATATAPSAADSQARQGQEPEAVNLAKQISNPIADLVSIPVQFNWENGVGANDDLRLVLNVQPVVPFSISTNWNLVGRLVLPFISQPAELVPGSPAVFGPGDMVLSMFLSPKASRVIWGAGPVFGLPTSTDPLLASGKWSAGPTFVVLEQSGPWTFGMLANHLWSFANTGDEQRSDVSTTFVQPFLAYTTENAWTFTLQSESTYAWEAESGQRSSVPVNLQLSKMTKLGPFPMSVMAGVGYYAASPDAGPRWKLRMAFVLILPRTP